jgi:glucose-fructose oxidoreductase
MNANQQATQMDDDALAIIERRPVLAPGESGLQGVRILSAIQEAASMGQTVDI